MFWPIFDIAKIFSTILLNMLVISKPEIKLFLFDLLKVRIKSCLFSTSLELTQLLCHFERSREEDKFYLTCDNLVL